uniref:Reverse transcriptase RNase H-like domain-containing protein n=1 Tax=Amphimedon queenslandica TaxID=400682 RepID=A0A1X7TQQ5_AMPQE
MGSIIPRDTDQWSLVVAGAKAAHKLPSDAGSNTSTQNLFKGSREQECTAAPRQPDSSSICKQRGQYSLYPDHQTSKRAQMWCLQRDILLTAQHLLGKENVIADRESRVMKDCSDWMLNLEIQKHLSCKKSIYVQHDYVMNYPASTAGDKIL